MKESKVSRSTISRIPLYLQCLKSREFTKNISATVIARELGLGDVQVRKDLSAVCGAGRPKTGYDTEELVASLERFLGYDRKSQVVLVGAGKLGRALLDYGGFREYGLEIGAAFDIAVRQMETSAAGKPIYPMDQLEEYIRQHRRAFLPGPGGVRPAGGQPDYRHSQLRALPPDRAGQRVPAKGRYGAVTGVPQ